MYTELDNSQFDYIIFGTSLEESILSAYLSKSGKKVLHLEISKIYGGDCKNYNMRDFNQCKYLII
jgi:RAB protein geranylgeranyltransferase component A